MIYVNMKLRQLRNSMIKPKTPFFLKLLFLICIFAGCSKPIPSQSEFALDTVCTITLYEHGRPQIYRAIFDRLLEIEQRMSVHLEGTDVDRINKSAGVEPVKVNNDVFMLIERAVYFAELSGGAFDPSVGPLVSLWNIGGDNERVPSPSEIESVLPLINWRDIELDSVNKTVFLKKPGMALDLGGIAKGYAADEAASIIKNAKIPRAIVDLGGNIITIGTKPDRTPWRIGIQNPVDDRGAYIGIVQIREKTAVTSGVYERFFIEDDVRYHHIFSTVDGYPAENGLLSVTIITGCSADADALSTAVFVLGFEKGMELVNSLEGVDVIFVFEDRSVRISGGIEFTLTDENFRIVSLQ